MTVDCFVFQPDSYSALWMESKASLCSGPNISNEVGEVIYNVFCFQDGRVLFLHMFWQGLKYYQLQANKDAVSDDVILICLRVYS